MYFRFLTLWLLAACVGGPSAQAAGFDDLAEPYFETVAGSEAIPYRVVTALRQDHAGLLWIGSQQGLLLYDGYRLRSFSAETTTASALRGAYVYALAETDAERLWIGTQSDGLFVLSRADGSLSQFRHQDGEPRSLVDNAIYAVAEDGAGGLWIGSNGGLMHWQASNSAISNSAFEHVIVSKLKPNEPIRSLLVDRAGDLWVGTLHGLYRRRNGGEFEIAFAQSGLAGEPVGSLFESADGSLWVGTQSIGAFRVDPARGRLDALTGRPAAGLERSWVRSFAEVQPGEIWMATWGVGVAVVDGASCEVVRRIRHDRALTGGLGFDFAGALWTDRSGLLWVGTWGAGLQRHNPSAHAFRSLRHRPGLAHTLSFADVYSLYEDLDGTIWVGLDGGGIDLLDRKRGVVGGFRANPADPTALGDDTVSGIVRTAEGSLWVGTQQAGLHRFDPVSRSFQRFGVDDGLISASIRRLFVDRSGILWIGTEAGLDRRDPDSGHIDHVTDASGAVIATAFWTMAEDAHGRIWAGTPAGLFVIEPAAPTRMLQVQPPVDGRGALSHRQVRGVLVDSKNRLWVDTAAGLDRLLEWNGRDARFEAVGPRLRRPGFQLGGNMQEDRAGRIWSARFRFDPERNTVDEFGRAEGVDVGNNWVGSTLQTRDGLLLFGGTEGLLIIDPEHDPLPGRRFQPPVLATEIKIDGEAQPMAGQTGGLVLRPSQRRLSLEFAALDFAAPEKNRYAYRLDGVDPDWVATDAGNRVASYNNLWPGDYQLRVRGSNRVGMWSEHELSIPLRVLPAYWQTPWFAAVLLVIVIAVGWSGVRLRTRNLHQRARALQHVVEQRTAELRGALEELTRTQRSLVEREKMASLGGLVAGVAHEINTPMGLALTATSHFDESMRALFEKFDAHHLTPADLADFRAGAAESTRIALDSLGRARSLLTSFKQVVIDQQSQQRRRFDLLDFLQEVRLALQASFRLGDNDLQIDCSSAIQLDSYPGALAQILTQLVSNSVVHAYAGLAVGEMTVSASVAGERLLLIYRDRGAGMSAEVAARAFEPFFTTRRGGGSIGLGLHIVFNLATRLLGGNINLKSEPGAGCELQLDIPLHSPEGEKGSE